MKKKLVVCMVLLASLLMLGAPVFKAEAKTTKQKVYVNVGGLNYVKLKGIKKEIYEGSIKNFKSSNKKIVDELLGSDIDQPGTVGIMAGKAGKATVTFKLKSGKKLLPYKLTVVAVKLGVPVKSVQFGKKTYTFKKGNTAYLKEGNTSGLLAVKPATGWKILKMQAGYLGDIEGRKLKNNQKVKLDMGEGIWIVMQDTKYGIKETLYLQPDEESEYSE